MTNYDIIYYGDVTVIKEKRKMVTGSYREGTTNELIAVRATTMTMGAPMIPAVTAASPMTNAPTILTA